MLAPPYLLYLGNCRDPLSIKTARGVAEWRPDDCVGERRLSDEAQSLGLKPMTYRQAVEHGARTVVIGVANRGGVMSERDKTEMLQALRAGLNVASGLHERLHDQPELVAAAEQAGCVLHDVRAAPDELPVGDGASRAGFRVLTVGTDCSVGKMYTSLGINRALRQRGVKSDFRATGQTGIMIAGNGVPVDNVISDFVSGAVEMLSPAREDGGIDVIEGQGSLFHPSYSAVSLGLLHGAQPDVLVLCHEAGRTHIRGLAHYLLPSLHEALERNLQAARLTNASVRAAGISLNSRCFSDLEAGRLCSRIEDELELPVEDPMRTGLSRIADRILKCRRDFPLMASVGR